MHIIIFTGGIFKTNKRIENILSTADFIFAADEGAAHALSLHILPQVTIGDFDSLDKTLQEDLKAKNCLLIPASPHKDETDTQLAIQYAIQRGATSITVLGGIEGNRLDHIFANIFLATSIPIPLSFVSGATVAWIAHGPYKKTIRGHVHDLLSLIPLSPTVTGIKTHNLQYPLRNETLFLEKARGISNVFLQDTVSVTFNQGMLLLIHMFQDDF